MLIYPRYPQFARTVHYWRKKRRISRKTFAQVIGVPVWTILCLEQELLRPDFHLESLEKMAQTLRIPLEVLINGTKP